MYRNTNTADVISKITTKTARTVTVGSDDDCDDSSLVVREQLQVGRIVVIFFSLLAVVFCNSDVVAAVAVGVVDCSFL